MGNILTSVVSYDETDVYIFKDTDDVITTVCQITFVACISVPSTAASNWTISSTANALVPSKFDVTLTYYESGGQPTADYTLLDRTLIVTDNLLLTTFIPSEFFTSENTVIVRKTISDPGTITLYHNDVSLEADYTSVLDDSIFSITSSDVIFCGILKETSMLGDNIKYTQLVLSDSPSSDIDFNGTLRVPIVSAIIEEGSWLITASGTFNISINDYVYFWIDSGDLTQQQYINTVRKFKATATNTNVPISMHSVITVEQATTLYWCSTPNVSVVTNLFSTSIPSTNTSNLFIEYMKANRGLNSAKMTCTSISS